jgi:hypothetical protein
MAKLNVTVNDYDFDGDKMSLILVVDYKCSRYYPATGPSFNSPGEPAEGGEIEEVEVTLLKASPETSLTSHFVGIVHELIEKQVKQQVKEGGELSEKIEELIYAEPPPDDDDYYDDWRPDYDH